MCGICNAAESGTKKTIAFFAGPLYTPGKEEQRSGGPKMTGETRNTVPSSDQWQQHKE